MDWRKAIAEALEITEPTVTVLEESPDSLRVFITFKAPDGSIAFSFQNINKASFNSAELLARVLDPLMIHASN